MKFEVIPDFFEKFCCRDPSSALTLATRLYEETRLGNYNIYSSTLDFTISSYVWDFKTSLLCGRFCFQTSSALLLWVSFFFSHFEIFLIPSYSMFLWFKVTPFSILTVEWFYKHIFLSLSQHFFLPNRKSLVTVY